jgi:hypothetical protein
VGWHPPGPRNSRSGRAPGQRSGGVAHPVEAMPSRLLARVPDQAVRRSYQPRRVDVLSVSLDQNPGKRRVGGVDAHRCPRFGVPTYRHSVPGMPCPAGRPAATSRLLGLNEPRNGLSTRQVYPVATTMLAYGNTGYGSMPRRQMWWLCRASCMIGPTRTRDVTNLPASSRSIPGRPSGGPATATHSTERLQARITVPSE